MVSDVPLMYGIVAVVVGVELAFVLVRSFSRSVNVSSNKVVFVVVFVKNTSNCVRCVAN